MTKQHLTMRIDKDLLDEVVAVKIRSNPDASRTDKIERLLRHALQDMKSRSKKQ